MYILKMHPGCLTIKCNSTASEYSFSFKFITWCYLSIDRIGHEKFLKYFILLHKVEDKNIIDIIEIFVRFGIWAKQENWCGRRVRGECYEGAESVIFANYNITLFYMVIFFKALTRVYVNCWKCSHLCK